MVLARLQPLRVRARHDGAGAGLAGAGVRLVCLPSRVTGVYFSIITQALTYALMLAFFRNDMGFGGNNGFTDFKDILGFDLHSDTHARGAAGDHRASCWRPATWLAARLSNRAPGA